MGAGMAQLKGGVRLCGRERGVGGGDDHER